MLNQLKDLIRNAEDTIKKSPRIDIVHNRVASSIENLFYGNLLTNFESNLIPENFEEFKISKEENKEIIKNFKGVFNKAKKALEETEGISEKDYISFKEKLKTISLGGIKLLLELEKAMEYRSCKKEIDNFKERIKSIGRNLKVGKIKSEKGSLGVSIGFDDDEDSEESDFEEEITDFDNFSIDLEEDFEEDINYTHKNITLEDENGHFYGEYNQSPNQKYIIAFDEGYIKDNKPTGGQVYLIENQKKIFWKKRLERPNAGFVTNQGEVIIIDWTSSDELMGKLLIFSKQGKKVFEQIFESNIGGQDISHDGKELIITTCNPDNSIYLFDINNKKLLKKIKNNTSQKPLVNFVFSEIRNII